MWFSLNNCMVVLGLATSHHDSEIAGTFAQQLGWVFVGPFHPSAHGPPAKLRSFRSLQMVHTHTRTHTYIYLHIYSLSLTRAHAHTHTRTHTDIYIYTLYIIYILYFIYIYIDIIYYIWYIYFIYIYILYYILYMIYYIHFILLYWQAVARFVTWLLCIGEMGLQLEPNARLEKSVSVAAPVLDIVCRCSSDFPRAMSTRKCSPRFSKAPWLVGTHFYIHCTRLCWLYSLYN